MKPVLASIALMSSILTGPAMASGFEPESTLPLRFPVAPSCPALGILGFAQDMISPPVDPVDIAINLMTGSGELGLPDQFGIEVSPYWLLSGRKEESFSDYAEGEDFLMSALRGATLSLAYGTTPGDSSARSLAAGLKVPLLQGGVEEEYGDLVGLFNDLQGELNRMAEDAVYDAEALTGLPVSQFYADARQRLEALQQNLEHLGSLSGLDLEQVRRLITGTELRRTGLTLDLSMAASWNVSRSDLVERGLTRYGVWLSGGYDLGDFSTAAILRYMGETEGEGAQVLDVGGRAILNSLDIVRLSGEIVCRYAPDSDQDSQWRMAGDVLIPIGANRALNFSFGKDYSAMDQDNGFLSAGVTVGIGSSRPVSTVGSGSPR